MRRMIALLVGLAFSGPPSLLQGQDLSEFQIPSSLDGEIQPVRYWLPPTVQRAEGGATSGSRPPLFVFLHSWSSDYRQANEKWLRQAVARGWVYLHPNFRGVNDHPEACGSRLARQDILDAVDEAVRRFPVDTERLYLAGVSGGGHMTMLMAGHHPDRFSAASAWAGISNLADWYRFHTRTGEASRYARMIHASLQGPPGFSASVDFQYRDRSPVHHLHQVGGLPLEIATGVHDGKSGSVPIHHSLRAFNAVASAHNAASVTEEEMDGLWETGRLPVPTKSDQRAAEEWSKAIFLRRTAGPCRVTIFDGGHESLAREACDWLSQHRRRTRSVREPIISR